MQKSDFSVSPDDWTKSYESLQGDTRGRQELLIGVADLARVKSCYTPVQSWLNATAYADTAQVKNDLQEIASDSELSKRLTSMAAYQLGLQYYQTLHQKFLAKSGDKKLDPFLDDQETQAMQCFLGKATYSDAIEKKVAMQSRVIDAVAHVLHFDPNAGAGNWLKMTQDERQTHLLNISDVSDYVLKQMDMHPQLRAPALIKNPDHDHVGVVRPLVNNISGLYVQDADLIFITNNDSYGHMVGILKHEKTHQFIYKEAIAELDAEADCALMNLSTFHNHAVLMFQHGADAAKHKVMYSVQPQERLAKEAEKFPLLPYMTLQDRQDEFVFLEDSVGRVPETLSFLENAMKCCKADIESQEHLARHEARRRSARGSEYDLLF